MAELRDFLHRPATERRIGPFRLVEQLGRGGFAPVWLCEETYGGTALRTAAVKLFGYGEGGEGARRRDRSIEEARALCQVEHPNVVRFYSLAIDEEARVLGLAMEHLAGTALDLRLARTGRLDVGESLEIGIAIGSALSAVHRAGLVHRDVKPSNVIDANGVYKLIDFGIAAADGPVPPDQPVSGPRAARSGARSRSSSERGGPGPRSPNEATTAPLGGRWGTEGYVDPVCETTSASAAATSDLYALGVLLFECLVGELPSMSAGVDESLVRTGAMRAPPIRSFVPEAPPELERLVAELLEPDRARRPTSAEWVATQLEQIRSQLRGARRELPPEDVGPFRGLGSFGELDHDVYFGRTGEVATTLQMMRGRGLVALVGPSGSGKSSLARAGVAPAVAEGALGGWPRAWDVAIAEPGRDPRANVLAALAAHLDVSASIPGALVAALATRAQATERGLIVVVDQLEELASVPAGPSLAWTVELLALLGERVLPGVRALVTLRRDMFDRVLGLGALGKTLVRGSVLVEPLGDVAWSDVLEQALGAYGYAFEDEATRQDVLAQLRKTSGAMPLAQFALTELWRHRDTDAKQITRASLATLGGIAGALERHAESTLGDLGRRSPAAAAAAERTLVALTTPLGTRRAQTVDELVSAAGEPAAAVVQAFEEARLVLAAGDGGVTLAHEALLEQWGRLRGWVAAAREDRLLADALARDADAWSRDPEAVQLWPRRRLAHADDLRRREVVPVSATAAAFLGASRRAALRTRMLVGAAAFVAVASSAVAAIAYLDRNRRALAEEQNQRLAAEEQTRQVRAKQVEIDRLLGELEDSRTKEKIVTLQREIRGEQAPPPPAESVEPAAPVTAPRARHVEPSSHASAEGPAAPAVKVQKQW